MQTEDIILYDNTSVADLLRESHETTQNKRKQILDIIQTLSPLIRNVSDATVLGPIISKFLEVSVTNDEHLIKLVTVMQRLVSAKDKLSDGNDMMMSEQEREELLKSIRVDTDVLVGDNLDDSLQKYLNTAKGE